MMDYLSQVGSYLNVFKREEKPKKIDSEEKMSRLDGFFNCVYRVVCWEDPTLTWISFICINLLYALIIYFEVQFYCAAFSIAAILVALDYSDVAIDFTNVKGYLHLKETCSSFICNLQMLKRDNPPLFCFVMVFFFFPISVIGHIISGRILLYLAILGTFFGRIIIKLTPVGVQNTIMHFINLLHTSELNESDIMPILSENFDEDINDDNTQDSFTSELIKGLKTMPENFDGEDTKDLDEMDFLPKKRGRGIAEYSSDSNSDLNSAQLHFDSQHFVRDSSSSDDDYYVQGMKATDVPDVSQSIPLQNLTQTLGIVQNLTNVGTTLLSNWTSNLTSQPQQKRRDSSDNSDFEFVNKDDVIDT